MSDDRQQNAGAGSSSMEGQIDRVCDQFEAAWKSGQQPRLEEHLANLPEPARDRAFCELLELDLAYRLRAGQSVAADDYKTRFPQFGAAIHELFEAHPTLSATVVLPPKPDQRPVEGKITDRAALKTQDLRLERTLHIRCPHCHTRVSVDPAESPDAVVCSSCGSQFRLIDTTSASRFTQATKRLEHFDLLEQVGAGNFGTVWKARDNQLDRTVAVKIPRKGQLTATETEQFLREARVAAQLKHPNIVSIHEVGSAGDSHYIASDFVRGVTLADWLTGQKMTPREAATLCATLADALHHAHERGVVHRDLKPSNIMIDLDGQPHIMDFGLAKRDVGEVTLTLDGGILGTPAYMSPEQASGKGHQADRRSDISSLGAILFQLLTNEPPFRGNAHMMVHQVLTRDAPSPRSYNHNVPRDLETICLKCLEKAPEKRFATAAELADDNFPCPLCCKIWTNCFDAACGSSSSLTARST